MFLISPVFVQALDTILIYQYYPDVFWISYSEEKSIGLHKKKRNTAMDVPVAQLLIRAVGLQIHVHVTLNFIQVASSTCLNVSRSGK